MGMKELRRTARRLKKLGTVAAGAYLLAVRPWHMRWGATDGEVEARMPGDEIIQDPDAVTTRAITIKAPVDEVWPWITQLGQGRGGYYSYDWLENLLGLEIHSADHLLPPEAHLEQGDIVSASAKTPDEGFWVQAIEPEDHMVLRMTIVPGRPLKDYPITIDDRVDDWMDSTWSFHVQPIDAHMTRLIVRLRADGQGTLQELIGRALIEPAHFVMERRMLKGIKKRAEGRHRQVEADAEEPRGPGASGQATAPPPPAHDPAASGDGRPPDQGEADQDIEGARW